VVSSVIQLLYKFIFSVASYDCRNVKQPIVAEHVSCVAFKDLLAQIIKKRREKMTDFDVLIVGSGISGIGSACHLKMDAPWASFAILEGREAMGGTWDLFRYPGIRSDSDMHTLGFRFKPWTHEKSIADAPAILDYLHETAREYDIESAIRYGHKVKRAAWDSETARWTVTVSKSDGSTEDLSCRFIHMCTGYYSYSNPYRPEFAGEKDFKGQMFHPQFWPEKLDFKGKKVVVIGSGATAVTIVPAMAEEGAGHVTMLQRSPTYFISRPAKDKFANRMRSWLPNKLAYSITRWKNITMQQFLYNSTQKKPEKAKQQILDLTAKELPAGYDIATHFTPRYYPWQQRLCLVPDSDFFEAIKRGKAEVVTDHIDHFTANGITLKSGKTLDADIVVAATGLNMEIMSGIDVSVDGRAWRPHDSFSYMGAMYSDVPNLASTFGYSNASWTLKADLISQYVCRLLNHMKATGDEIVTPVAKGVNEDPAGMMNLTSGYVERAMDKVPRMGDIYPWRAYHDYKIDKKLMLGSDVAEGWLHFAKAGASEVQREPELAVAAE
jgi:monooxygenase